MKFSFLSLVAVASLALLSGCATDRPRLVGAYTVEAHKPHNPANVKVQVSTSTQRIYVMEGDRPLMAVQGCVGEHGSTTKGNFRITNKILNKRSNTFGFSSNGSGADAHKGQSVAVGYPMGFWCEFAPAYGFHEGFVWDIPRTHGCIRMHRQAAARFFALVRVGTPVNIAETQPEDSTIKNVRHLDQRNDPDPPASALMSSNYFQDPPGTLLED